MAIFPKAGLDLLGKRPFLERVTFAFYFTNAPKL